MATANQLLAVLSRHIGKGNGIGVKKLAEALGTTERHVRSLVEKLRRDGGAICAHPKTGYFVAETQEELERYYIRFLTAKNRAARLHRTASFTHINRRKHGNR